jgi:hypothetical protein
MIREMMAKSRSKWMKRLLTCIRVKPPSHKTTRTIARIRNMEDACFLASRIRAGREGCS